MEKRKGVNLKTAELIGFSLLKDDKNVYYMGEKIKDVKIKNFEKLGQSYWKNDNKIYYSANNKHPYSRPLVMLFSSRTDVVAEAAVVKPNVWEEYVRPVKNYLACLIVTNRLPGQEGVDLLIVGDDKTKKLTHWAEVVEKKEGKPLNYVIMSRDDFQYRLNVKDRFVSEVLEMSILEKIDPEGILAKR